MSATSRYYRPPTETKRTPTYEELFGTSKSAERIAYDKQKEQEARISAEEARRTARAEDKKRREALLINRGKELVGTYREQYSSEQLFELGAIDSIETAKIVADETYKQYWYDKANDIVGNWTDEDYKLIAEPQYEDVKVITDSRRGTSEIRQRRVLPEGYEELQEINSYIEKGPLDFSSEETHKMLINPAGRRGYGKYQTWISPNNPLRQAVEAQADVMKKYLDREGISITKDFEGGNPDNVYGEGIYLNTGTAAHIDWDSDLKRMQRYMTAPDSEVGTYSQVFYRPEASSILDHWMVDIMAAITGTQDLLALGRGGDLGDVLEDAIIGSVAPDFLETGLGQLGIDADLFGIDPNTFSDSINEVQTEMIKGKSGTDALVKEFGGTVVKNVGEAVGDIAGGALGSIVDLTDDVIDAIGDTALVGAIEEGGKYLLDKGQDVINAGSGVLSDVEDVVKAGGRAVDDTVLQPVIETVEKVVEESSEILSDAEDIIKEGGRVVDDTVIQPVVNTVEKVVEESSKVLSDAEDVIKETGRVVDDTIIQPVVEAVEAGGRAIDENITQPVIGAVEEGINIASDILSEGEDIIREGGRVIDDTIIQPIIEAVENIDLPEGPDLDFPDIDFPDINLPDLDIDLPKVDINLPDLDLPDLPDLDLPDLDLPDLDLPDLPDIDLPDLDLKLPELSFDPKLLAGLMPQEQQPTQVEGLFDKELFKFDTEIKSTQEMLSPFMNLRRYG